MSYFSIFCWFVLPYEIWEKIFEGPPLAPPCFEKSGCQLKVFVGSKLLSEGQKGKMCQWPYLSFTEGSNVALSRLRAPLTQKDLLGWSLFIDIHPSEADTEKTTPKHQPVQVFDSQALRQQKVQIFVQDLPFNKRDFLGGVQLWKMKCRWDCFTL